MEKLQSILRQAEKLIVNPPTTYDQKYLLGFRGLLVIETFLFVFLRTFVPVTVAVSADPNGRLYQEIIRKTLSVLFWNEYFLYGAIIFLSARSVAIPFINSEAKDRSSRIARSVVCRNVSLCFPVAVSLAICKLAFSQKALNTIFQFKTNTGNNSLAVPYFLPTALAYFNSVFNIFWTSHNWSVSSGSTAFPSQTLWIINAVYVQSYTVYMTMIIIPYTRKKWRVQGAFFFVVTAWWVQSWAWYTISGLILCDMVMNMDFQACAQRGIPINIKHRLFRRANGTQRRIPVWIPAGFCLGAGLFMQYVWTAWRPDLFDKEYEYHTGLYYTAGLNVEYTTHHTAARGDIYLMVIGFFILLETYSTLQRIFQNKLFVFLGRRSLSYFLTQSIMIYVVGIRVFTRLRVHHHDKAAFPGVTFATLVTCLAVTIPVAELFYRLVELPSKSVAHKFFDVLTK